MYYKCLYCHFDQFNNTSLLIIIKILIQISLNSNTILGHTHTKKIAHHNLLQSSDMVSWGDCLSKTEWPLSRTHLWVQTLKEEVKSIYSDVAETQPIQTFCHLSMSSVIMPYRCTVHGQKMRIRCKLSHMNLTWFDWLIIVVSMLYIDCNVTFTHTHTHTHIHIYMVLFDIWGYITGIF